MYGADWTSRFTQAARSRRRGSLRDVPANVWGLGVTSFLTDVSSEMVISVLPAYLVLTRGATPLALGIANGLHEGGAVLAAWIGGLVADRTGKRKLTAAGGYVLSALCRAGWVAWAGSGITTLAMLIVGDRLGKAIRTAPRDALISLSGPAAHIASAFGVHRALDAAGATIGPVVAWLLLWRLPQRYDAVFVVSLIVALLGVAALFLLVSEPVQHRSTTHGWRQLWTGSIDALSQGVLPRVLVVVIALSLVTIRDAFLYLLLVQRAGAGAHWIPLLYTGTALAFLAMAAPVGQLADRHGRARAFVLGHVCLIATYALATGAVMPWPMSGVICVLLLGTYYACSDGVLPSLTSALLPSHVRTLGLAWVATGVGLARLCSSVVLGLLWARYGDLAAVFTFTVLLVIVIAAAWLSLRDLEGLRAS